MKPFWSKFANDLVPYVPGEQPNDKSLIKLNTNENPYPPSPEVLKALTAAVNSSIRLYPDPSAKSLKTEIAKYFQIGTEQVFLGNGSDEVLAHAFLGLFKQEKSILFPDITYEFYSVYCKLYGINYKKVPLTNNFEINIEDYRRLNGGIIFPNPNALTGCYLPLDSIVQILAFNRDSVVLIDEAYIDFGGETASKFINEFPNLLIVQTLSKSRSLAGLRVGFAIGNSNLIEALERIKNSFNPYALDKLAIEAAIAAMRDKTYFENTCRRIVNTRKSLTQSLLNLGFEVIPSQANFLLVRHRSYKASELYCQLRKKDILVRHFPKPRVAQFLRITIGTDKESSCLVEALENILESNS